MYIMQIRGKNISWQHLRTLYQAKRSNGLYLLKKLSKEHIDLSSYSRMRVDLAAEVSIEVHVSVLFLCFLSLYPPSLSRSLAVLYIMCTLYV